MSSGAVARLRSANRNNSNNEWNVNSTGNVNNNNANNSYRCAPDCITISLKKPIIERQVRYIDARN